MSKKKTSSPPYQKRRVKKNECALNGRPEKKGKKE
jgi:hypothetical protein